MNGRRGALPRLPRWRTVAGKGGLSYVYAC